MLTRMPLLWVSPTLQGGGQLSQLPPHCKVKPHFPESPRTFALGALISQDLPHKEAQLRLLMSISRFGKAGTVFAATMP